MPGPRGTKLLGSLLEVRRDRLSFVRSSTSTFGDAVAFRMGPRRLFLMSHPDAFRHVLLTRPDNYLKGVGLREARPLLGDGLLTAEGEKAAEGRRRLRAAFSNERLRAYSQEMVVVAEETAGRWIEGTAETLLTVNREMAGLTLEVLSRTLLREEMDGPKAILEQAARLHGDLEILTEWAMAEMTSIVPWPLPLPSFANRRARQALGRLEAWVAKMTQRPAAVEGREPDLLDLLRLAAASPREIRDELLTFLLAGHDTTAASLTWAFYLLAHHPEIQEQLGAELLSGLGDRPATFEDLGRLPLLRAVVDETLRLYPPVWLIPRRTRGDDVVAGWEIPKNSDLLLSTYTLHRHPDFWTAPETFDPGRFLENGDGRHAAFMPFGLGARSCLGASFGLTELRLMLATLVKFFRIELVEKDEVLPSPSLTLHPSRPIRLRLTRRGKLA